MDEVTLKLNQAKVENNILTKQLQHLTKDYGDLLFNNRELENQLANSTEEVRSLRNELSAANYKARTSKDEFDAKVREICNEVKMLKKQNYDLSEENSCFEEKKMKYEEKLSDLRLKCEEYEVKVARLEKEKEEIWKKQREEHSRVSAKNLKLERDYNAVMTVATDKFRMFESRLSRLERDFAVLNDNLSDSGSQLINTTQVQQVEESFGAEEKIESHHETTPIVEKTASSLPSPKADNVTCFKGQQQSFESDTRPAGLVGTEEKSASSLQCNHKASPSLIDLSSSDDDDEKPLPRGLKRKLSSPEVSCKVEDGDSFSRYRSKEHNDSSAEYTNLSKKTMAALKPCEQKFYKWDYEADLLEDLQKDTELCMKGVCVLYRQHMLCIPRETSLAKYLADGDAKKELKRTLSDVENDPKVADDCRRIALGYSKQLFDIYKNGKDPLFAHDILLCQKTIM